MNGYAKSIAAKIAASIKSITVAILLAGVAVIIHFNHGVDTKIIVGEIAGYVNLIAYFPYFVSIIKGDTKPSKTTWWIWSILEIMLSSSYIASGAESTKWLPIAGFVGMLLTAILSVWYGKKAGRRLTRFVRLGH